MENSVNKVLGIILLIAATILLLTVIGSSIFWFALIILSLIMISYALNLLGIEIEALEKIKELIFKLWNKVKDSLKPRRKE